MSKIKICSLAIACAVALSMSAAVFAEGGADDVRIGYGSSRVNITGAVAEPDAGAGEGNTMYTMLVVPADFFTEGEPVDYSKICYMDQVDDLSWDAAFAALNNIGTKGESLPDDDYVILFGADNAAEPTKLYFTVDGEHGLSNVKVIGKEENPTDKAAKAFSVAISGYTSADDYKIRTYFTDPKTGNTRSNSQSINEFDIPNLEGHPILQFGYQINGIPADYYPSFAAQLLNKNNDAIINFGSSLTKTVKDGGINE